MPFTKDTADRMLASGLGLNGTRRFVILASPPPGDGSTGDTGSAGQADLSSLSIASWPTAPCALATDATVQIARGSNFSIVDFGTVTAPFQAVGVGVYSYVAYMPNDPGQLLAWSPFVDASGHQVTRAFQPGDQIRIPVGALTVALAL